MKKIYLLFFAFTIYANGFSQQTDELNGHPVKRCATNPHLRQITPTVTLPVIFHIIHDGAEAVGVGRNVSQAAIRQQMLQLNKDFANRSGSPYAVSEDMGIQFAMAQNDPNGIPLAEPGIERIDPTTRGWNPLPAISSTGGYTVGYASTANNYLTNTIKPNSIWDPTRYLNIWVSQWEAGILGIATFPGSSGLSGLNNAETNATAGVTISYATVGSIFTPAGSCASAYGKGKTLTHELGHFFGLRHIWGDGVCATDYCNDTPTHQAQNNGDPQHPKPNACGTADEMFENFMDYVNDLTQNTFTVNQGDRMEAVWANSPRRASLATSNVGLVPVTASNRIAFADCDGSYVVSEASGMSAAACPKFKDLSITLNVEDRATAAATVNILTTGNALNGVDFILNTPTLTFAPGDQAKAISIRIIDDGVATGNKTLVLSYTISGSGLVAGTTGQTLTISLVEDDLLRTINHSNPSTVLLSEDFGTTANNGNVPVGWFNGWFGANSTNVFTVNSNYGAATGFSGADGRMLHITNGTAAEKTAETATNTYTTTITGNPVAMMRSINTIGYKNIKFNFDYACFGELIGSTLYDVGRLRYTTTTQTTGLAVLTNTAGNQYYFYNTPGKTASSITLPATLENMTNVWLGFEWLNSNTSGGTNPPFTIDNIVVTGDALQVETAVSTAATSSQKSGQTAQYTTSANKIIATITNPNENINCITASVTSTGTSRTVLNTNAGSFLRSDKMVRLSPAAPNTTASYQATFYYTADELTAWGADVPNLKILKVADGVDLSSTLTAANAAVFTPVVNDQRVAAGYVSYTVTVTGGFSQFLLASPLTALPVSLLSFDAKPNGKTIYLSWSTANEINNKGFVIERSTDAANYKEIGWVDGAINSSMKTNYNYADNFVQPGQMYYYRLRQTDLDNVQKLSSVRQAKISDNAALEITLSPNPAKNEVKVFVFGTKGLSSINLIDSKGGLVKTWRAINVSDAPQKLNLAKIAAGSYILQVINNDVNFTGKLVIE
ncbi:MAG: T9SS type A sorting domain-containing protein [Sphingobacteriales bacterium]|nr:MAG: T9SS type A sorting domain-containing protein [Sphingobacteriales bacterium]